MQSSIHRFYTRLLKRYQANGSSGRDSPFNRVFEAAIIVGARFLMAWHRLSFPERETGGWWWTWRYRFEFLCGWMDAECTEWCDRLIEPGMTVIDIGAHLGFYARRFSRLVGPHGRVIAFEPNPENYKVLRKNLRGYRNVVVWNRCVTERDGWCVLHVSQGHSNHSLLSGYTESHTTVEVESVALDSFLEGQGIAEVGFIKSDTEGAEPLVIAGMRETLARPSKPTLLLELNPAAIQCGGTTSTEFVDRLEQAGYQVRAIAADGSLTDIPQMTGSEYCNILCRPLISTRDNRRSVPEPGSDTQTAR